MDSHKADRKICDMMMIIMRQIFECWGPLVDWKGVIALLSKMTNYVTSISSKGSVLRIRSNGKYYLCIHNPVKNTLAWIQKRKVLLVIDNPSKPTCATWCGASWHPISLLIEHPQIKFKALNFWVIKSGKPEKNDFMNKMSEHLMTFPVVQLSMLPTEITGNV